MNAPSSLDDVLEQLLVERYSCRAFTGEPVSQPTIERLLSLASRAPSWCNTQPWHTHVTVGSATERFRRRMKEFAAAEPEPDLPFPAQYTGAAQERRRAVAWQLYDAVGVARGDRDASAKQAARNFDLFGAPHVAIVTTLDELGVYGAVDCGLYVQTFLLSAQSLGLGAIPQAALAAVSPAVRDFLEIPSGRSVVCGISFGWAALGDPANSFRSTRTSLAESVTWHA